MSYRMLSTRMVLEGINMKKTAIFLFTGLLIGANMLAACGQAASITDPGAPAVATAGLPATAVAPVTAVVPVTPAHLATAIPPSTVVPPKSASVPATAASPATAAATTTLAAARTAIIVKPNPVKGDTCSLLSKDEVGNILGEAVVDLRIRRSKARCVCTRPRI